MLRKKALNRIYFTTLILFITLISLTFNYLKEDNNTSLEEIEFVSNLYISYIYLLNEDNYLVKVDTLVNKGDIVNIAKELLNDLSVNNFKYNNLKGLISSNTKINNITYENNILTIDFSNDLLKVSKNLEEKVIESIVYTLLEIEGVDNIIIKIDGNILEKLEKSNKSLPILLNNEFGINKDYNITSIKDIQKVILYYEYNDNDNIYYIPVTKYVNSREDKIKIIIDTLKGNYFSNTNLISYLNKKNNIDFKIDEDILTLTFDSLNEDNLESVTYLLACSVFDTLNINKVIFEVDSQIVSIRSR